jgi:nicotinamidase-related amidase
MANLDAQLIVRQGMRFGPLGERWVHVCVDMQRLFGDQTEWHTPWLPRVVELVACAPERTIFTRFVPPPSAEDVRGTWRRYYRRWATMTLTRLDPALVALMPELEGFVPPARIVDKPVYSPWIGSRLAADLARLGVDTIVVSGAETEVCVLATVLGAVDLGLRTLVAVDAICSSADATHDAMLEIYHSRFGMQVSAQGQGNPRSQQQRGRLCRSAEGRLPVPLRRWLGRFLEPAPLRHHQPVAGCTTCQQPGTAADRPRARNGSCLTTTN